MRAYERAESEGRAAKVGEGARALRADDAHARADRQRLDDVQGQVQPGVQSDGAARPRRASLESLHRDPRSHVRRRDGGVQPRLDQPRPPYGGG